MFLVRSGISFLAAILFSLSVSASLAHADDAPPADDTAERIEVTGSHIKRMDVEGVSPVETFSKKAIEEKGYDNLGDVVRDIGANSFGSGTPAGNNTTPGNADISLRGLGSDNTLVLLNGQRLPPDAIAGSVDINLIPLAAVERIEILKDGASAVYGSDALAGVVNIITRKDYEGTEVSATQSLPTQYGDGKKTQINLVNGINGEKFNIVTALDFRYDQAIFSRNRPWSNNQLSTRGNPPSYANDVGGTDANPNAGNDGPYMSPGCPSNLVLVTPAGTFCQFRFSDYSEEMPQVLQIGGMSEAHYNLSSNVKLDGRVSYNHRDAQTIAAPAPNAITIPSATVATLPTAPTGWDHTSPIDMLLRLTPLGTRNTDVTSDAYGGLLGATVQLPHDWSMDVTANANSVNSHLLGTSGFALINGTAAANNGTNSVNNLILTGAFNPFLTPGSQGSLNSAAYQPYENTQTILTSLEAKASGDLVETSQGPISIAFGTLVFYQSYTDIPDAQTVAQNVFGTAGSVGEGHRSSEAVYTEASIPLVKKKLELQLAGRYDHYSDFGDTVNPKVGFLYHATDSLLFRGSVGTGFRAPLLSELYQSLSLNNPSFIDYYGCARNPGSPACSSNQYQVVSGGNPNLKQETSVSYTVGAIYEPTPKFNIGTDWFFTQILNTPGIDYNDMTQAQQNGINPNTLGVIIPRDPVTGLINGTITAPFQNLSATNELGVDITGSYLWKRFKFASEQNQLFYYNNEGFPGAGLRNKLGWFGLPAWRNTTSVSYTVADNQEASFIARTIPAQLTLDRTGMIHPLSTFDLSYSYHTKKIGTFTLSVINLLDSSPPTDFSQPTGSVNYSLYDPNDRQIVLGYKYKFL